MAQIRTWEKRESDADTWNGPEVSDEPVLYLDGEPGVTLERLEVILELRSLQESDDILNYAV